MLPCAKHTCPGYFARPPRASIVRADVALASLADERSSQDRGADVPGQHTLRRECLDHLVIVYERHLRSVLAEFVDYYNRERPHRALRLETPIPASRPSAGPIRARPVLGCLHHSYERAA